MGLEVSGAECNGLDEVALCYLVVGYDNLTNGPLTIDAMTTLAVDGAGNSYSLKTSTQGADNLVVNPGLQMRVSWSVTIPLGRKLTEVQWQSSDGQLVAEPVVFERPPAAKADTVTDPPRTKPPKTNGNPGGASGSIG